ncbi:related to 4-coumarate--CoA ligase [Phialocephala subalpina]|uniref:Related to 4-coumarate--CoA ligase n=1 Tax=Phialocephala subalpina TaxID=576137 RepID=A0A1L7X0K1_9HELO|nr:related to 4-coumarate--CoA ligase [Phialocephala subalpina]
MPIHSRWTIPLPVESLQTHLFKTETAPLPQKPAFLDAENPSNHLTYDSFRLLSLRLAAGLQKAGLQRGDRVLLFSGNNVLFPAIFMGIVMAGGVFTGANPGFVERELAFQLKDSGARFCIVNDAGLELGIAAASSNGMNKEQLFRFGDGFFEGKTGESLGVRDWTSLLVSEDEGRRFKWVNVEDPKDETIALNYSSGTTGVPKGVEITHFNYVSNCIQYQHLAEQYPDFKERTKVAVWLCPLPLYHAMAQTIYIAGSVKRKIPVYIMKKFDFVQWLEAIQKYRVTGLPMVPPLVVALAKSPLTKKYDLSSVKEIGSGAAPLSGEVIEECEALWPTRDRHLRQGWGMTEVTCSLLGWDPTLPGIHDSVGELNANCSAKIMDVDGKNEMPVGERGELWCQAPNVMKGYWRNPKATAEVFVDGPDGRWMRTGDIAYVDKKGRFFIVDRMKELIKVKGLQVAPAELEGVLLEHPDIDDAGVVGVTIKGEEVPRAYLVRRQGSKVKEREVVEWLAKRVSKHKRLVGGVVFLDAVPKNPSGKILRKVLRERAREEVGDKDPGSSRL